MKRIFSALLAACILLSAVACSTASEPSDVPAENTTVSEVVTENELTLDLPEKNYGGAEFRILTDKDSYSYIVSEKTSGVLVDDAILEANMEVANRFGIRFQRIDGNADTYDGAKVDQANRESLRR